MISIWRFLFGIYVSEQENFPYTKLGIGWNGNWFYKQYLHTLKKEISWGPSLTLYFYFGNKIYNVWFEYRIKK